MPNELCCENCFNSYTLKRFIRETGTVANCSFCESSGIFCIEPIELRTLFWSLIHLYEPILNFMYIDEMEEGDYTDYVWDKMYEDWEVFTFPRSDLQGRLIKAMYPVDERHGEDLPFLYQYVEDEAAHYGIGRAESEELSIKWDQFSEEIKGNNRYFTSSVLDLSVLENLLKHLSEEFNTNKVYFRARISHDGKRIKPSKMGKPTKEKAQDGRANPRGIPYLYLASLPRIAISEVRPFIKDKVTVGIFRVLDNIKVVDLRRLFIGDPFRYGEGLKEIVDYIQFLHKLGRELSKAINPRVADIEYIPTQYLSEFIKSRGYDGIVYGSSMIQDDSQFNMVIFNDEKVKCVSTKLYEVTKIVHEFKERKNPVN